MQGVQNFNTILIGGIGVGKTYYSRNKIIMPDVKAGRKVLILHTTEHPDYADIQPIRVSKLAAWCKDKTLMGPRFVHSRNVDLLIDIVSQNINQNNASRATIVFDDFSDFNDGRLTPRIRMLFTQPKQKNYNLLVMGHFIDAIPKRAYKMTKYLGCMKTQDDLNTAKSYLPPNFYNQYAQIYPKLQAAEVKDRKIYILRGY